MRATQSPYFTQKENPADALITSHRLLMRAGFIYKQASGLYAMLPLGHAVLMNIENIIREEMINAGAIEVKLPTLIPGEFWQETKRWEKMGPEMMRLNDRHDHDFVLGPTHEESITDMARALLQSYKQLPINIFQIGNKFRDEIRPRYGLIRAREFIMKDAYSFHEDSESLEETYQAMRNCYRKIFARCSLETIPVEADSGNMGGAGSEEFMVSSDIGEENLLSCDNCGYKGNQEKTKFIFSPDAQENGPDTILDPAKIATSNCKSIAEVSEFLGVLESKCLKAVVLESKSELVLAFIHGHKDINLKKVIHHSTETDFEKATESTLLSAGLVPGYIGPLNLQVTHNQVLKVNENEERTVKVLFDENLKGLSGLTAGANEKDYHIQNISQLRDFPEGIYSNIAEAAENDQCPACNAGSLKLTKGIEVGHIFKLGQKYTEDMSLKILDKNGKTINPTMGCYGIGLGRTLATIVEQNHDEKGIIWPESISPYDLIIISLAKSSEEIEQVNEIYENLKKHLSVYYDDRKERPGVKFADAELIGVPYQLILGKMFFNESKCELKTRKTSEKIEIPAEKILDTLAGLKDKKGLPSSMAVDH